MDEDNLDDNDSNTNISFRGPSFRKDEVKNLIRLIEKHKQVILNKCTNTTVNHAKELTWNKIAKEMNKQCPLYTRNAESLKTKWDNLKREARKQSKNLIDVKSTEMDAVLKRVLALIKEADVNMVAEVPHDIMPDNDDIEEHHDNGKVSLWDEDGEEQSEESSDGDDKRRKFRSLNFNPQETSLLLKCVRDEKKFVFSKDCSARAIKLKNIAWSRITQAYNRLSPQKRSTKVLRTKFFNIKTRINSNSFNKTTKTQTENLGEENNKKIKTEAHFEYEDEHDLGSGDEDDFNDVPLVTNKKSEEFMDPLSTVLNGDSGIDSISHSGSYSQGENKEVINLKLELLKYQLETAKLERQRIQELLQADSSEKQTRAIESALRLRAARLEAVAAEMKLPSDHPALLYHGQETAAQQYLAQYH